VASRQARSAAVSCQASNIGKLLDNYAQVPLHYRQPSSRAKEGRHVR
jgi:hypothetical protein